MTQTIAANGSYTTHGIPHGATSLTPFIALEDPRGAMAFYRAVSAATIVDATELAGAVVHADLDFGNGHLQLGAATPDYHLVPPPAGDDDSYSLALYCA